MSAWVSVLSAVAILVGKVWGAEARDIGEGVILIRQRSVHQAPWAAICGFGIMNMSDESKYLLF